VFAFISCPVATSVDARISHYMITSDTHGSFDQTALKEDNCIGSSMSTTNFAVGKLARCFHSRLGASVAQHEGLIPKSYH
jgi:hypothetical protein